MNSSIRFSLLAIGLLAQIGCGGTPSNDQIPEEGTIHLMIEIPVASDMPNAEEMAARNAIIADLDKKKIGELTGSGGGFGAMDFSYNVKDEENARKLISEVIGEHLPDAKFTIRGAK